MEDHADELPSDDSFPALLRQLRLERQLTQEELADAAELSVRAVRNAELGLVDRPRTTSIRRLADALHLSDGGYRRLHAAARGIKPALDDGTVQVTSAGPDGENEVTLLHSAGAAPGVVLVVCGSADAKDVVEVATVRPDPDGEPVLRIAVHHETEEDVTDPGPLSA